MAERLSQEDLAALEKLEQTVEAAVETLWQSAVMVDDFRDSALQPAFNQRIEEFVEAMKEMDDIAKGLTVKIPLSILQKVDQGMNPDLVTKEQFEICRAKNAEARGKLLATQALHESLRAKFSQLPDLS